MRLKNNSYREGLVAIRRLTRSISVIMLVLLNFMFLPVAHAASLSAMSDTMTRERASTASNHTIKFTTPSGVSLNQTITVTFPAGFTIGSVAFGDIDLSYGVTTGAEIEATLAATPSTTSWGAVFAGQILTLTAPSTSGNITAGYKVIIEIGTNAASGVNQIINHATPTSYLITLGGTFADSGTFRIVIVADDQVDVSGLIDASITFTLSANASPFGALSTAAIATSTPNITLTIGTNANSGYAITVRDQGNGTNPGMYNAGTGTLVASATAGLVAGTEGYGIQATQTGGATVAAPYTASGSNVGALATAAQTLATYATSTTSNHTVVITHKIAIATATKAGTYADTITYIATANY